MTISRCNGLSASSLAMASDDCAGRLRSITASRVNTAVDSRNGTNTTIRLMNAVISRWAGVLRRRRTLMMVGRSRLDRLLGADLLNEVEETDLGAFETVDDLARLGLQERVDQQERNRDHQRERGVVHRDRDRRREHLGLLGGVDLRHGREALDQADDGAEQSDQRDHVGEGGDVVGALLEARHDFHHAFFHRRVEVFAPAGALHPRQAVVDDLADGSVGVRGDALHVLELALLQHRQHLCPDLAVLAARLGEEDEALDRDRDAERHDRCARIYEQAAILEELDDGAEGIHELSPMKTMNSMRRNEGHLATGWAAAAGVRAWACASYCTWRRNTSRSTGASASSSTLTGGRPLRSPGMGFFQGTM